MRKSISSLMFSVLAIAFAQVARSFQYVGERVLFGAYWLVQTLAAPATLKLNAERWKEDQLFYTRRVMRSLSIYSHDTKSTGALCSPALS